MTNKCVHSNKNLQSSEKCIHEEITLHWLHYLTNIKKQCSSFVKILFVSEIIIVLIICYFLHYDMTAIVSP